MEILADFGFDSSTVIAAFLHDVLEDTPVTPEQLAEEFGQEILELVEGVTKLDKLQFTNREEAQAENFRKFFMAMAKDLRVIIVKLADRLHNMRSLKYLPPENSSTFRAKRWTYTRLLRDDWEFLSSSANSKT